jgi:CheY-like chemotaxis protein
MASSRIRAVAGDFWKGGPMANLLVVEDDPTLLSGMEMFLSMQGHHVRGTSSGLAALGAIATHQPELVISDVAMPGMTGPQLLQAVRARPDWEGIPFLFVSANTRREIERQLTVLDGVSFLGKPFDIDALYEAVVTALQAHPRPVGQRVGA